MSSTEEAVAASERLTRTITYRPASETDIDGQHAVFVAAEGELLARHGFGWTQPPPVDRLSPGFRHFLAHDGNRCFVAESDGRVVGYSAAWVRDSVGFLAGLFIDPAFQGMGVGRHLYELAMSGTPARRLTISDAIQPVSNALYARNGLLPVTPILGFRGRATSIASVDLVAATPDDTALALLDRAAYGFDRVVDHAFWGRQASGTVWLRGRQPVAYSYRWPTGRIGPLAGRDPSAAAEALNAELAREATAYVEIPGTSRSLVRAALAAGLRLGAPPGLLLMSDEVEPPSSLAISSYGLM